MILNPLQPLEHELRAIDIHELLPQQEPFVMIDTLVAFDRVPTVTELEVRTDNVFVDGGSLSTEGLMENIAQTCAARIGYVNKYILKKGVQIGFIGALRNIDVNSRPVVGDVIITRVDVIEEVFGMTWATATVTCHGNVIANGDMKIAIKDDEK